MAYAKKSKTTKRPTRKKGSRGKASGGTSKLESNTSDEAVVKKKFTPLSSRVDIRIYSRRKRLLDPDGVSEKAAIDGLVHSGLLEDDTSQYIREIRKFQEKVGKDEKEETLIIVEELDEDSCIEWEGRLNAYGYGMKYTGGKDMLVHRLTWEKHKGPIPTGMLVCHTCDNPACYNTNHLFLGTQKDNMKDCADKGRIKGFPKGLANIKSTLTHEQVLEIRKKYIPRKYTMQRLCDEYGVAHSTICRILHNTHRNEK